MRHLKLFLTILVFVFILLVLMWTFRAPLRRLAFEATGEEQILGQVRGLLQYTTNWTRPQPDTRPDASITYASVGHDAVNPFGINTFLEQEVEPAKRERQMQMIANAGFKWIRQEFPWADIEIRAKGDFMDRRNDPQGVDAWAKYDNIIDLAQKYNVQVMARLTSPPAWTRAVTETHGAFAPPDNVADYADFVEAALRRYKGQLRFLQIWNEPNLSPEWGSCPTCSVDPEAYTRLLCAAYARAKSVDPDAVIVSGALGQTLDLSRFPPGGMNEFIFLQRMYDAGAGRCFDILSVNDYGLGSGPTDRRLRFNITNFSRPMYLRDVMVKNGDERRPIWIAEVGWNAVPNDPKIIQWGVFGQVTQQQQGEYLVRAYQRIKQEWPWVGVAFTWFFKPADEHERNQAKYYFRIVDPDFTPLPAYNAIKAYATQ
jgi:hypothetical protein